MLDRPLSRTTGSTCIRYREPLLEIAPQKTGENAFLEAGIESSLSFTLKVAVDLSSKSSKKLRLSEMRQTNANTIADRHSHSFPFFHHFFGYLLDTKLLSGESSRIFFCVSR